MPVCHIKYFIVVSTPIKLTVHFYVYFIAEVENSTYQFYPWGTTFDVDLHGNVSVSSSGGHSVQFAAGEYLYNIKKSGMYFSVTLENGDVSNLGGICGES